MEVLEYCFLLILGGDCDFFVTCPQMWGDEFCTEKSASMLLYKWSKEHKSEVMAFGYWASQEKSAVQCTFAAGRKEFL